MPDVQHLSVRSLPFNGAWRKAARARWLQLKSIGVQQKAFAAWCGCAQGSVSNVLGEREPSFWRSDYLERFSLALGISLPLRAQVDVESDAIGDDDVGLGKVLDLIRWSRDHQPKS